MNGDQRGDGDKYIRERKWRDTCGERNRQTDQWKKRKSKDKLQIHGLVLKITWGGERGWREASCVCKSALKEGGTFQLNIHYTASPRATFSTKANPWSDKTMFIFIFSC